MLYKQDAQLVNHLLRMTASNVVSVPFTLSASYIPSSIKKEFDESEDAQIPTLRIYTSLEQAALQNDHVSSNPIQLPPTIGRISTDSNSNSLVPSQYLTWPQKNSANANYGMYPPAINLKVVTSDCADKKHQATNVVMPPISMCNSAAASGARNTSSPKKTAESKSLKAKITKRLSVDSPSRAAHGKANVKILHVSNS